MKSSEAEGAQPPLTSTDYATLAEFRYLLRSFVAFSETAARRAGLTPQHHQALLAIRGFSRSTAVGTGELADLLNLRHHSVVGLIDRLVAKRLVRRLKDTADHRRVRVALTPTSERLLAALSATHREELRRVAPLLRELLSRLEEQSARDP